MDSFGPLGSLLIMVLPLILVVVFLNRSASKQRKADEQQRNEAIVVGRWVLTRAGFYGRIVDIDGDVVILETVLGDESMWDRKAIVVAKEPPLAEGSTALDGLDDVDFDEDVSDSVADLPDSTDSWGGKTPKN